MGPQGKWVEVQIRTKRMNEIAEKGPGTTIGTKRLRMKAVLTNGFTRFGSESRARKPTALTFVISRPASLAEEIYVYTPKLGCKDVLVVPRPRLCLCYPQRHRRKTIGAKVNHKLVPISHKTAERRPGREIITSNKQKPSEDWGVCCHRQGQRPDSTR